jgi:DeoR/GlpR family transcriptional regulator of sugar metabolism
MSLTTTARHEAILGELDRAGSVRVTDLAARLAVSIPTIRRDLVALAGRGRLRKVHGGAVAGARGAGATPGVGPVASSPLARAAVALLAPDDAVAVVGGAGVPGIARAIVDDARLRPLTVVTTSLPAALVLAQAGDRRLATVVPGGEHRGEGVLSGAVTEENLAGLHVGTAIVECAGIGADGRVTARSMSEAATFDVVRRRARRTIVVVARDRVGRPGLARWASLDDVDVVVVEGPLDAPQAAVLAGTRVVVAG